MVRGGLAAWEDHVKAFTRDYALWDAGYDAYVAGDKEWLYENIGAGITETEVADIVVMFGQDGKITYESVKEELNAVPTEIFTPDVIAPDPGHRQGHQRRRGRAARRLSPLGRRHPHDRRRPHHAGVASRRVRYDDAALYGPRPLSQPRPPATSSARNSSSTICISNSARPAPEVVEAGFPVISDMPASRSRR